MSAGIVWEEGWGRGKVFYQVDGRRWGAQILAYNHTSDIRPYSTENSFKRDKQHEIYMASHNFCVG